MSEQYPDYNPESEVSLNTTYALLDAVDEKCFEKKRRSDATSGRVRTGADLKSQDGINLSVSRFETPDTNEKEYPVVAIIHISDHAVEGDHIEHLPNMVTNYHIVELADHSLKIKKQSHLSKSEETMGAGSRNIIEVLQNKIENLSQLKEAQEERKKLGMDMVSEKEARTVIDLIRSSTDRSLY